MIILTACNNKTKESTTFNDYKDAIKTHEINFKNFKNFLWI